ncbi:MAG: AMIN domain-containing protein, partial [Saprospiraceae bacterium]|nr:AMIN domain-containing protein [Saprospiraceae bacterium]
MLLAVNTATVQAAEQMSAKALKSVQFASLPGNKAQIILTLSEPAESPLSFTIDNPARIALDFPETTNQLKQQSQSIGIGMAESITTVEAQGRTRVVVNLTEMVPYEAHAEGNNVVLTIQGGGTQQTAASAAISAAQGGPRPEIENVDFRRGENGEGRVIVELSDPSIPVDMQQQDGKIIVDFYRTNLPSELERRLDVLDFATPVKTIDTFIRGENVHMVITPMGEYD